MCITYALRVTHTTSSGAAVTRPLTGRDSEAVDYVSSLRDGVLRTSAIHAVHTHGIYHGIHAVYDVLMQYCIVYY